jgi:RecB family exonuclease
VHEALRHLYDPTGEGDPGARNIERIVHSAFRRRRYPNEELRAADVARTIPMIRNYLRQDGDAGHTRRVETDERFTARGSTGLPITFAARLDRLVVRPDEDGIGRIIDYKTGAPGEIDLEGATITLAVARVVYKDQFRELVLQYDYLSEEGLAHRMFVTPDDVRPLWSDLLAKGQRVYYASEYSPNPGPQCQYCPLRSECRPVAKIDFNDMSGLFE